jgi:hypothetical protein
MKKLIKLAIVFGLAFVLAFPAFAASAQSATSQTWTSAIQYQNTGSSDGAMVIHFFDTGGGKVSTESIHIDAHGSGTLLVGSVGGLSAAENAAVVTSSVPLVAVTRSFVTDGETDNYDITLSNGYEISMAGPTVYLPTLLKQQFGSTSRFGIQNTETEAVNVTIDIFEVGNATPVHTINVEIPAQSSYIASMNDITEIGALFSGSLRATADDGVSKLVATSEETYDANRFSYGFEGVASGASKVFIPTMLCEYAPPQNQTSYYAIQAVGGGVDIEMKHYDKDTGTQIGSTYSTSLSAGGKASLNPCTNGNVASGAIGSSVVEVTGGTGSILALVKINSGEGMRTAYTAEQAYTIVDTVELALPYVPWENPGWKTFIAVQNLGDAAAEDIVATYYNADGSIAGTHVLATSGASVAILQKVNTSPANVIADPWSTGTFSGSVVISSDQPVTVVARIEKDVDLDGGAVTKFAEDYTGQVFETP